MLLMPPVKMSANTGNAFSGAAKCSRVYLKSFSYTFCHFIQAPVEYIRCFLCSQALQHTTYLQSRLPQALRRRAQSTASSVARRLGWPPAMSAGTSISPYSSTHLLSDSKSPLSVPKYKVVLSWFLLSSCICLKETDVTDCFPLNDISMDVFPLLFTLSLTQ